jgi:hypothetical protein
MRSRQAFARASAGFVVVILVGCQQGPTPPQKGTPAFYWQAAMEAFQSGDYLRTSDHLEQIARSENEYTGRAQPWRLVLTAGMAKAWTELADHFEYGARANKTNPTPFRRNTSDFRNMAARTALHFAETFEQFEKTNKDQEITLQFPFPPGNTAQPPQLTKAAQGMMLQPAEVEELQKRMLQRGMLLQSCAAAGTGNDTAKLQQMFKAGEVKVPRDTFVLGMARALYDQSQLFTPTKLDQPDRLKFFATHAGEALKPLKETKERKELMGKIEAALKSKRG